MTEEAIKRGVDLCLEEVRDLRDWKFNLPGDKDCCVRPVPGLREQFVLFTKKIIQDFSMMNISDFVRAMSPQGGLDCSKPQQRPDNARLFDCHVRGQIEQARVPLSGQVVITNVLPRCTTNSCYFSMVWMRKLFGGQPIRNFGVQFDHVDSDKVL